MFNRLITAIILLLVTGSALAAAVTGLPTTMPTGINLPNLINHSFAPPTTDYSVAYLGQIFGTVGNVLDGSSGQILGKMFAIFNKGVMVVAALWLAYTTFQMVLKASQEGSFMGQNRNVPVMLLRIALGFALIIPSSATGYSLLQDIFMRVVVAGVGLADQTWDAALNYMQYGGALYIPPATLSNDTGIVEAAITTTTGAKSQFAPVTQLFQDEVCMIESQTWENQQQQQSQQGGSSNIFSSSYHPVFVQSVTGSTGQTSIVDTVYFPGVGNSPNSFNPQSPAANCGSAQSYFAANQAAVAAAGFNQDQTEAMRTYSWGALQQLVNSMLPAAKLYVDQNMNAASGANLVTLNNENANNVFAALIAYLNLMTPYQRMMTQLKVIGLDSAGNPVVSDGSAKFIGDAESEGWIMAGRFFWDVEKANQNSTEMSISALFPQVAAPIALSSNLVPNPATYLGLTGNPPLQSAAGNIISYAATPNPVPAPPASPLSILDTLWANYMGTEQNNISASATSGSSSSTGNAFTDAMIGKANSAFGSIDMSSLVLGGNNSFNPIVALMSEGTVMLNVVVSLWIAAIVLSFATGAIMGICASMNPGDTILKAILVWVKTLVSAICLALLVPGVILAYYVPIYPFAVFTFAAIGWIAIVIEGMAAAPLVCMGLTHPAGEEFLGKAEQALMLFLSIFMRPVLMVIGLIASMIVSFVAFKMVLIGFAGIFHDLAKPAYSALNDNSGLLHLINGCITYVIFGFIVMEIIEQSFKLIYQLPNNIMSWIGAPQTASMGQEFGHAAKGVSGAVSSAGQGMQGAAKGMDDAAGASGKFAGEDLKKQADAAKSGASGGTGAPPTGTP